MYYWCSGSNTPREHPACPFFLFGDFFTEWNPLELSLEQYLKKKQQKRDAPDISEAVPKEKEQRSEGDDEVMRDDISWEDIEGPEDAGAGEENPAANGEGEASQKRHKKKK